MAKKENYYTKPIMIRTPPELYEVLKELSFYSGYSMNQIIQEILIDHLEEWDPFVDPNEWPQPKFEKLEKYRKGELGMPDRHEKMQKARFIIRYGISSDDYTEDQIRDGEFYRDERGRLFIVPKPHQDAPED